MLSSSFFFSEQNSGSEFMRLVCVRARSVYRCFRWPVNSEKRLVVIFNGYPEIIIVITECLMKMSNGDSCTRSTLAHSVRFAICRNDTNELWLVSLQYDYRGRLGNVFFGLNYYNIVMTNMPTTSTIRRSTL